MGNKTRVSLDEISFECQAQAMNLGNRTRLKFPVYKCPDRNRLNYFGMGQIKRIELSESQRAALETGYRDGKSHAYRRRCQMILLKSQGRSSKAVAQVVGGCEVVVNSWLTRYQSEGISGLQTRPGRGRPAILDSETDLERVRQAVSANRQRLSLAKAALEAELGKEFCSRTLTRFVKKTVQDISDCGAVHARSQTRTCINSNSNVSRSSRSSLKPE